MVHPGELFSLEGHAVPQQLLKELLGDVSTILVQEKGVVRMPPCHPLDRPRPRAHTLIPRMKGLHAPAHFQKHRCTEVIPTQGPAGRPTATKNTMTQCPR